MLGLISYCAILLALSLGTVRRPAIGMAAVLCLYGLKQWGQSATALFSAYPVFTNYAVFTVALLGVARAAQKRACIFCDLPTSSVLILALYLYAFMTISWAPDTATSIEQWITWGPYILTVTLMAPLLLNDLDDARTAFIATALAGAALCLLALLFGSWGARGLVMFGHTALDAAEDVLRYETNPLALSSMAGTVFVICALSLGRPNGILMRALAMACIPVALAVVLRSGSRGQLIASGIGVLIALPIARPPKDGRSAATLLLVGGIVLGLAWWGSSLVDVDSSRWANASASKDVAGRLDMAEALLGASTSNFFTTLFGLGNSSAFHVIGYYPHITGLEVLAEEGLFGAVLYFSILYLAFRSIKRISGRLAPDDPKRNALAILSGLFVFELILSWKQGSLLFSVYVFSYAIALARLEMPVLSRPPLPARVAAGGVRFQNLLR